MPIPSGRVAIMAVAVLLAGCTMCPDPYDYSGPVPNGSSPQNNFRARSNGILPVGAAPVPWPPIVKSSGPGGHDGLQVAAHHTHQQGRKAAPTLADPAVESAAGDDAGVQVEPISVLVTAAVVGAAAEPSAAEADQVIPVIGESGGESPGSGDASFSDRPGVELEAPLPVDSPAPGELSVEIPSLAETPGWRPRQPR